MYGKSQEYFRIWKVNDIISQHEMIMIFVHKQSKQVKELSIITSQLCVY